MVASLICLILMHHGDHKYNELNNMKCYNTATVWIWSTCLAPEVQKQEVTSRFLGIILTIRKKIKTHQLISFNHR